MTLTVNDTNSKPQSPSLEGNEILKESKPRIARADVKAEIAKQVVRKKLSKLRHLVVKEAISPAYLDSLFPKLLELFQPQTVTVRGMLYDCDDHYTIVFP